MRLGLFTDIHFQAKGLNRIVETSKWIIEEFKRQGVERVVCLGDSLNTREQVSVEAQSACIDFFKSLAQHWKVEVLLGNHDMNLKHDRKVSSLDALALHPQIDLYREPGMVPLEGCELLMLPYFEDQSKIVELVTNLNNKVPERVKNMVAIAHAGINGAMQITRYGTKFKGALGPDAFKKFKRTYTGHFHVHQRMDHRVTYVGSPLQFNFGDSGDTRGVMIYDTVTDEDHFVRNPFHDAFVFVDAEELKRYEAGEIEQPQMDHLVQDRFITLVYKEQVTEEQYAEHAAILEGWGAIQVRKESILEKSITNAAQDPTKVETVNIQTASELVPYFVDSVIDEKTALDRDRLVEYGQSTIRKINEQYQDVADTGSVFRGDIAWVHIQGFMAIQDAVIIRFDEMKDGVWYIEGENGAGKSTIIEAVYWCLFGLQLRSDTKVDDVINDVMGKNCKVIVAYENGWAFERFRKAGKGCVGYDGQELSGHGVRSYFNGQYQPDMEKGEPKATQRKINDLLGIDADKFAKTQVMGQNITTNFITADEKKRRAMIEEMLGLERFDAYLEEVRTHKKALADERQQQQSIQQIRASELERLTQQLAQTETRIREAEGEQQEKINQTAQSIHDGNLRLKVQQEEWAMQQETLQAAIEVAKKEMADAKAKLESIQGVGDIQARANTLAEDIKRIDGAITNIDKYGTAIENIKTHHDQQVKTCEEQLAQQRAALPTLPDPFDQGEQDALAQELRILEGTLQSQRSDLAQVELDKARALEHITHTQQSLDQPEAACSLCGQPLSGDGSKDKILAHIQGEQAKVAEYDAAITERQAMVESNSKRMEEIKARLVDSQLVTTHQQVSAEITRLEAELAGLPQMLESTVQHNDDAASNQYEIAVGKKPLAIMGCKEMVEDLKTIRTEKANEARQVVENSQGIIQDHREATQIHEEKIAAHASATTTLETTQKAHDEAIQNTRNWLDHYAKQMEELKQGASVETLKQDLELVKTNYKAVREELEQAKDKIVDIQEQQSYVMFWDRAFAAKGGMRSYLMRDSVASLNQLLAAFTEHLFDNGMTLNFTEEMTIVESYGKRSGGQRKRSDLAALFATFFLSRQRLRYRSGLLPLDEVFDALDKEGIRQVQTLINVIAPQLRKVLVITHADITGASMAGSIYARLVDGKTTWEVKEV